MSTRSTLDELLASVDRFERDIDRSTQAIERCIEHLTVIEQHMRRAQTRLRIGTRAREARPPAHSFPSRLGRPNPYDD